MMMIMKLQFQVARYTPVLSDNNRSLSCTVRQQRGATVQFSRTFVLRCFSRGSFFFAPVLSPNANHDLLQTGSVEGSSRAASGQERVSPLRSGGLHPAPPPLLQPPCPTHTQTEEKESKRIFPRQRQPCPPTDLQAGHSTLVAKREPWKRL